MGGNALAIIDSYQGEKAKKGDFIQSEVQEGLITSLKDSSPTFPISLSIKLISLIELFSCHRICFNPRPQHLSSCVSSS